MNQRGKEVDKTYLSLETASERGFIHRDYIAHCLRWSHVAKYLAEKHRYMSATILDVGCGRELPLARTLYSMRLIPLQYFGVDAGPINDDTMSLFKSGKFPLRVWEKCDILMISPQDLTFRPDHEDQPNVCTCFEVLEHVEPKHMLNLLAQVKHLMSREGVAFFSTPCWNVTDCAANHVNEMRYEALGAIFEATGWTVDQTWGTFASIRDYEHLLGKDKVMYDGSQLSIRGAFDALREYYDTNVLSCIFAPLFPTQSRNALWRVRPVPTAEPKFKKLDQVPAPWGSSNRWEEMHP